MWSNGTTSFAGLISAQGGPRGGDGGQIETSGETVDFPGLSVNASSLHGKAGTWLVDPQDLTVDGAAATTIQNSLDGGTGVKLDDLHDRERTGQHLQRRGTSTSTRRSRGALARR